MRPSIQTNLCGYEVANSERDSEPKEVEIIFKFAIEDAKPMGIAQNTIKKKIQKWKLL